MWNFTPDNTGEASQIPYLEDAKANAAPNYASTLSTEKAMSALVATMSVLGIALLDANAGKFESNEMKRYGYVIRFAMGTAIGEIRVAGLPMRAAETEDKVRRAKVQALLTARDLFQAILQARVFIPGAADFLMLFLLVDPVNKPGVTLRDQLRETGNIPELPATVSTLNIG